MDVVPAIWEKGVCCLLLSMMDRRGKESMQHNPYPPKGCLAWVQDHIPSHSTPFFSVSFACLCCYSLLTWQYAPFMLRKKNNTARFISGTEGKVVLFTWIIAMVEKCFSPEMLSLSNMSTW